MHLRHIAVPLVLLTSPGCTLDYDTFGADGNASGVGSTTQTGVGGAGGATSANGGGGFGATGSGGGGAPGGGGIGGEPMGGGGMGGSPMMACPLDQFVTGFAPDGSVQCAAMTDAVVPAVNDSCSMYTGWSDLCAGSCSTPSKWGIVDAQSCTNGAGADNACITTPLGGQDISLFGVNPDGSVDGNDKFFVGLHCGASPPTSFAPCAPGEFVSAVLSNGTVQCMPAAAAAIEYFRSHCWVYSGWRNTCENCSAGPSKWGRANGASCEITGGASTCAQTSLGGTPVNLIGINTDALVNDNDRFFTGFRCESEVPTVTTNINSCPLGSFVTEIAEDGTVVCETLSLKDQTQLQTGCYVYAGWSDQCSGCTNPPSRWGRASTLGCELGSANTCGQHTLDGVSVDLSSYATDGNVNDDDQFYYGLRCF